MGTEFTLHTDEFLETLPEEMSKIDTSKLFCQRYSAVKPLFQCVGDLACPAAGRVPLGVLFVVARSPSHNLELWSFATMC